MDSGTDYPIQPATWRDLQELYRLERLCFGQDAWSLIDLLGALTFPGLVRLKATHQEKMIGFVGGETRDHQQTGWIITLGVLPEFRHQGVAGLLLDACEQQLGTRIMRLCVRVTNKAAIDLYRKRGYLQVEIWHHYYRGGEDALVLEKNRL